MNGSSVPSSAALGSGASRTDGSYSSPWDSGETRASKKDCCSPPTTTSSGMIGCPWRTECASASLGVAVFTFWLATSTGTLPQSNHKLLSPSWPITLLVGLHRVAPRRLSLRKVTKSPTSKSLGKGDVFLVIALWTGLEQSRYTNAFWASCLARCCNAEILSGLCWASKAPSSAKRSSDDGLGSERAALPKTHCDGEEPPTRDALFFTMSTSCRTDSTCSLPRGWVSFETFRKRALTMAPWRSARPRFSGASSGLW